MPPQQTSDQDQPTAGGARRSGRTAKASGGAQPQQAPATPRQRQRAAAPEQAAEPQGPEQDIDIASQLSFREAQTALELSLAELQAADLDVEQMAGLYRRANRYAERCEELLQQVEQEVMQWDPGQPLDPPHPYQP